MSDGEKLAMQEHRLIYRRDSRRERSLPAARGVGGLWGWLLIAMLLASCAGLALAHPTAHSRRSVMRSSRARHQATSTSTKTAAKPATSSKSKTTSKKRRVHHYYHRRSHHFVLRQKAPTRERTSEIQSALAKAGYYQGDPSGKWDGKTTAALQKFQEAYGLDATGKCDAKSLQKLGLGSDVAGVAAPTAPHSEMDGSSPITAAPPAASSAQPGAPAVAADPVPVSAPPATGTNSAEPASQSPKSAPGAGSAAPSTPHS